METKISDILRRGGFTNVSSFIKNQFAYLEGEVDTWNQVVDIGHQIGKIGAIKGVVNRINARDTKRGPRRRGETKILNYELPKTADVVIIGGGVIGCFIARELSRFNLNIVLLEKESDVACGATKANNGQIHTGIGEKPGTLKRELCVEAWPLYERIAEELDVPYKRNGLLVVLTEDTLPYRMPSFILRPILKHVVQPLIVRRGRQVGDSPRAIGREELRGMEPQLTDRAVSAVLMPGYGMTCPYKLTIALAENAIDNGATFLLETEVEDIVVEDDRVRSVVTDRGEIQTRFVVNAAGVYSDEVSAMAGAQEYTIHPRKGSILLFDKSTEELLTHQVSELRLPQDPYTKGGGVQTTVDGNVIFGPTADETFDKEDTSVTHDEINELFEKFSPVVPSLPRDAVITYFNGVRAATYKEDFVIKASEVGGFVHAGGIQSPGLTAAPKIAERVIEILRGQGLGMVEKSAYDPARRAPPTFNSLSSKEKMELIEENPLHGNVVCRCEHVTEAEIVASIHRPLPAVTMDAIKRRARAGMGRCQGGFCGPRVAEILARELDIPLSEVTKNGGVSHVFVGNTKEEAG